MIKNESEFKTAFIKSVNKSGGYCINLFMPSKKGTPDLYCVYGRYAPVMLEAKFIKTPVNLNKFIGATDMQQYIVKCCQAVQPHAACYLVGARHGDAVYITIMRTVYISSLSNMQFIDYDDKKKTNIIDIERLFKLSGIPKLQLQPQPQVQDLSAILKRDTA